MVRAPRYLERFRCVGAACEDHCCGGWGGIDVDPPTAEAYRQRVVTGHSRATSLDLLTYLEPNPEAWPDHPGEAALIPLAPGGSCPFFTVERLCAIQGALGEDLLPSTCDTFPRAATQIGRDVDLAGRLACPEVVRLALLSEDALTIEPVAPDRRLGQRGHFWIDHPWEDTPPEDDPRHHYHRVRARMVGLLQRRDASLAARMLALGLALGSLSGADSLLAADLEAAFDLAERRLPEVQVWLASTGLEADERGAPADTHDPTPTTQPVRGPHRLLPQRMRRWIGMPDVPPRFRRCLDRLRDGLGLPDDVTSPLDGAPGERVTAAYASARRDHLEPYLARRPWLFEHLLVNQIWLTTFPYHPERSFAEEHALLAFRVGLVRFQLVGAAAAEGGLTDALVVETIQAFDKYVDGHDFWERTFRLMQREQALDPASLAALLLA
jgi:lysine-N-methylase